MLQAVRRVKYWRCIKIDQPFLGLIKVGCYVWCSGNLDLYERDLGPAKIKAGGESGVQLEYNIAHIYFWPAPKGQSERAT